MNRCPKGMKMGGIEIECPYIAEMQLTGGTREHPKQLICIGNSDQCIKWQQHLGREKSSGFCRMWEVPCLDALDDDRICLRPVTECEMWRKEYEKLKKEKQLNKGRNIELEEENE